MYLYHLLCLLTPFERVQKASLAKIVSLIWITCSTSKNILYTCSLGKEKRFQWFRSSWDIHSASPTKLLLCAWLSAPSSQTQGGGKCKQRCSCSQGYEMPGSRSGQVGCGLQSWGARSAQMQGAPAGGRRNTFFQSYRGVTNKQNHNILEHCGLYVYTVKGFPITHRSPCTFPFILFYFTSIFGEKNLKFYPISKLHMQHSVISSHMLHMWSQASPTHLRVESLCAFTTLSPSLAATIPLSSYEFDWFWFHT